MLPTDSINRVHRMILIGFALIALASAYWAGAGQSAIAIDGRTLRQIDRDSRHVRGSLLDRAGRPLALTQPVPDGDGLMRRVYPAPAAYSVVGYASVVFGTGGAEAAYDTWLSGQTNRDLDDILSQDLLGRPAAGQDVRLTLDLSVQQVAHDLMQGHTGALALISVPDGEIVALHSTPTVNPNTLDESFQDLLSSGNSPFFNRGFQAMYQPGGAIYPFMIVSSLLAGIPVETSFPQATREISVDGLSLTCQIEPPADQLTLFDALTFGCPAPFIDLGNEIGVAQIERTLALFRPNAPMQLADFEQTLHPVGEINAADAVGQGGFLITPLEMAAFVAAFINDGNVSHPILLDSVRQENSDGFTPVSQPTLPIPATTAENARRIRLLLRANVARGTAQSAAHPDYDIGGLASVAYSGEQSLTWFVGYLYTEPGTGYAIALVLENRQDVNQAAALGSAVLRAAARSITVP